ncbi:MAG: hypothetical protein HY064_02405 [Bacteroidetes bacterium]|nr:hypothetical protein [Bacteroidota bacterium]
MQTKKFKGKYRDDSIRFEGYDYGTDGAYYLTICSHHQLELFSNIRNGKTELSEIGEIIKREWERTPMVRGYITTDEYVIMPNHFHGILFIHKYSDEPEQLRTRGTYLHFPEGYRNKFGPQSHNLASIVRGFKSSVTSILRKKGYEGNVWQRNYYERIIRNQNELDKFRRYIKANPSDWDEDEENPANEKWKKAA